MRYALLVALSFLPLGNYSYAQGSEEESLTYKTAENQYAIVIVYQGDVSSDELYKQAMMHAQEIAQKHGYKRFSVKSKEDVVVLKSQDNSWDAGGDFPQNLYYELIQSGNFGKQPINQPKPATEQFYSGYRVVVKYYNN